MHCVVITTKTQAAQCSDVYITVVQVNSLEDRLIVRRLRDNTAVRDEMTSLLERATHEEEESRAVKRRVSLCNTAHDSSPLQFLK